MLFLSTYAIYIKFVHTCVCYNSKISRPVKWSFLNFNLNGQNFAEGKNQDFMLSSSSMLNLHRILFCPGVDLDDTCIMQIDCFILYVFCFQSLFIGWLQHLVLCSM